jgi:nucleoid-associated protein YgaU
MFAKRHWIVALVAFAVLAAALMNARTSQGAAAETRHVVVAGETLWGIAASSYDGDPRKAVWRIEQRNGVEASTLTPGTVLYLPS